MRVTYVPSRCSSGRSINSVAVKIVKVDLYPVPGCDVFPNRIMLALMRFPGLDPGCCTHRHHCDG